MVGILPGSRLRDWGSEVDEKLRLYIPGGQARQEAGRALPVAHAMSGFLPLQAAVGARASAAAPPAARKCLDWTADTPIATCRPAGHCRTAAGRRGPEPDERRRARCGADGSDGAPAEQASPASAPPAGPQAAAAALARALCRRAIAGRRVAALVALLVAALTTLAVPLAVRRMIDFGFSRESVTLIDSYFAVMIGVVAVLALASAVRFYLVTTLGERIVADLREDVFAHLMALSPAYFDQAKTGEMTVAAHRRHHPDQGRGRRLGLGRVAQSRAVPRRRPP